MRKFVLSVVLLLCLQFAFTEQYVYSKCFTFNFTVHSAVEKASEICIELISQGHRIVSVALYEYGVLVVYENKETRNDKGTQVSDTDVGRDS